MDYTSQDFKEGLALGLTLSQQVTITQASGTGEQFIIAEIIVGELIQL
jgi:hypothetical protein